MNAALIKFSNNHNLGKEFVTQFIKHPPYKNEYGSFSAKALKKLLPLMRMGIYWNAAAIDSFTLTRIEKIITGEFDANIKDRVRNKAIQLKEVSHFKGLPVWLASYVVYDRHSEDINLEKWHTPNDITNFLQSFKQHSLRNPIVEQVITETLRVVKDIWIQFGEGKENFFDEIHIELGREMKNPAEQRKRITENNTNNENTNLRIKALLMELQLDLSYKNVRPFSPSQQEILKIYEDGVINSGILIDDEILKISKTAQPSKQELTKYKLWLEQKYRSPYTGNIIPLTDLFTTAYEIEHIIPQSRFFDDSFSNKVICESEINKEKDNKLAFEFIQENEGRKIALQGGKFATVFDVEGYQSFIKLHYAKNYSKAKKLMLKDIPEKMIERQLNDTRYISKEVKNLLSKIVRQQNNDEGTTANNLLATNGQITSVLKQDWGLNDIWNELIADRFIRLNNITNSIDSFGKINPQTNKFLPTVPLTLQKGFSKKRIDHRHHAMDALVIACATRNHINYLNNQSALEKDKTKAQKNREDLKRLLCDKKFNADNSSNYRWLFKQPWPNFVNDVKTKLATIVVSHKQNLRVINKTVNKYQRWQEIEGKLVKVIVTQNQGDSWAIRKSLHKDTVSGKVTLPRINVPKGKILTASRKSIDTSFSMKTIESITDTGIQKILLNYLQAKNNNPAIDFTPEGIDELNANISLYNDGKQHQPITKARLFEVGSKFSVGTHGNKKDKYVEGAKGTNLYFAIYKDDNGNRNYATIPFNEVVERQKQCAVLKQSPQSVPLNNEQGHTLLFHLSPNDLVFVPTDDEIENPTIVDFKQLISEQVKRIYKCVSFTKNECHFIPNSIASLIMAYDSKLKLGEFGSLNKSENSIDGKQIKACCWKIKLNRLGDIIKVEK